MLLHVTLLCLLLVLKYIKYISPKFILTGMEQIYYVVKFQLDLNIRTLTVITAESHISSTQYEHVDDQE